MPAVRPEVILGALVVMGIIPMAGIQDTAMAVEGIAATVMGAGEVTATVAAAGTAIEGPYGGWTKALLQLVN